MIVTVTMNPSVDISYPLETFSLDQVNRCSQVKKTAGGKGLNVTRVIHQMNENVLATGLLGGTVGEFIKKQLTEAAIRHSFSSIDDETRNCIAVLHDKGQQTEILESGPTISEEELEQFKHLFLEKINSANVITISGSLPKGVSKAFYAELLKEIAELDKKVVLDTSGESLKNVLQAPYKPYAIKPNLEELHELTGTIIQNEKELPDILNHSLFSGIPLIMVSLGKNGAFIKFENEFYQASIPTIEVVNPVGSGDATVAGMAIGLAQNMEIQEIIKMSMTLGMLNAMEKQTGHVNTQYFDELYKQIAVE